MSSLNFKPKRTAAALHGFLATARLSCSNSFTLAFCDELLQNMLPRLKSVATDLAKRECLTVQLFSLFMLARIIIRYYVRFRMIN